MPVGGDLVRGVRRLPAGTWSLEATIRRVESGGYHQARGVRRLHRARGQEATVGTCSHEATIGHVWWVRDAHGTTGRRVMSGGWQRRKRSADVGTGQRLIRFSMDGNGGSCWRMAT